MFFLKNFITFCDGPEHWQIFPQDPATPMMEGMIDFHNYLAFFIITIGIAVCWVLFIVQFKFNAGYAKPYVAKLQKFNHSSVLEIIWTIIPAVILVIIAIPSFALLYSLDELIDPAITVKIIGHQWYWSYEFSDYHVLSGRDALKFDCYMMNEDELPKNGWGLRLLETPHKLLLPINTHIRLLITSADVLHSWAVPSFGIKLDACPGRLSQASLFIKRPGFFYGQCSEICGVNHAFMPISIRSVPYRTFMTWVNYKVTHRDTY